LADQGDAKAQRSLGLMYDDGEGVAQDHKEAVKWYRLAAAQGDAWAQHCLGNSYSVGWGVVSDRKEAAKWYRLAAAQGFAQAQNSLGNMYKHGQGVPQDYKEAVRLFGLAAAQGNADAQLSLGAMYESGERVPQDYKEAVRWYGLAAAQGNAIAQRNLGEMYSRGRGVLQDYKEAAKWLGLAAAQGEAIAQNSLRFMHERGQGVQTNANPPAARTNASSSALVSMKKQGGTYVVPVLINNTLTLDFTVDSGAADVSIPEDVVRTLVRTGTIKDTDFTGEQTYVLADGSKVKSKTFRIRSLKVGDRVLENVLGSVSSVNGSLLLGQSFLGRFKSWSIDNTKHALVLE
jgi:hypothetical protein